MGEVTIELYWKHAPNTCRNFAELTRRSYYNNVKFHRIIRDFMIQGKFVSSMRSVLSWHDDILWFRELVWDDYLQNGTYWFENLKKNDEPRKPVALHFRIITISFSVVSSWLGITLEVIFRDKNKKEGTMLIIDRNWLKLMRSDWKRVELTCSWFYTSFWFGFQPRNSDFQWLISHRIIFQLFGVDMFCFIFPRVM